MASTHENKNIATIAALNTLLADYHMYYQKLRNFHWNITGKSFFELHLKFEELYNDSLLKIDEIAERILTLRHRPLSNYTEYLQASSIKEAAINLTADDMVDEILRDNTILVNQLKIVIEEAGNANDDGTLDIVGTYIKDLEKLSWMLEAYSKK